MKRKALFVLVCLLIGTIFSACQPSQAELNAQATKIAADVFATQTAEAPPPTPTPLPPTPTPTPLPPTPTPTPLPPTPTPTPLPPTPTPTPLPPTPTLTPLPPTPTPTPLPPTPTPTPEPTGITITGVITNLEDAEQRYLAEDSYLQLVHTPADRALHFITDAQGRLTVESELAQIPIPHDGVFTFQVESLEPGIYLIAAQMLRNSSSLMPFLTGSKAYWRAVEISQDTNLPLSFDLGEVTIPLP